MKRLNLYIILTGSLLLMLPQKIVNACGFYVAPGEYRFWLLQPDLTNNKDLTPFFFASTYLYKGNEYAGISLHLQKNIDEWYAAIKQKASRADIDSVLYHTEPQLFFYNIKQLEKNNSFVRYLLQPAHFELYQYIVISKKIEQVAANPDPWEEQNFPSGEISKLINETSGYFNSTKSAFLKLRYAYQLIRLHSFNNDDKSVEAIYKKYIEPVKTNSWIKAAALYQKTISIPSADYNYQLSKVFDMGNYNRSFCLIKFNSNDLDSTLKFAKNTHERNVLNAMKVFNYPGRSLSYIENIYKTEPNYKELPFLLLREINKIEDWLITSKVTEFDPAVYGGNYYWYEDYDKKLNYSQDIKYAGDVIRFIQKVIANNNVHDKGLWHLYAAHLALVLNDYNFSQQQLVLAQNSRNNPSNVRTQIRINQFLLNLHLNKVFTEQQQKEILSIIKTPSEKLGIYDAGIMKDQLILYTAKKLISNGERAKGLMLLSKTKRAFGELPIGAYKTVYQEIAEIAKSKDYEEMISMLEKKNKSAFEQFVTSSNFNSPEEYYDYYEPNNEGLRWTKNKLLDLKATYLINQKDLNGAVAVAEKIPQSFWKQYPYDSYMQGNPFFVNIYHSYEATKDDKINYNKKELLEKMIKLESMAAADKSKAAEYYYQLGNAWYNMTYHGKNWLMVRQWWSRNDLGMYNNQLQRSAFNDNYLGCKRAKEYYLKALNETKDKKLASLCCFMAGKCDNNYKQYIWCASNKKNYSEKYKPGSNPYIKVLAKKNMDDKYYKEIIAECAAYNSYIKQYNRVY